MLLSLNIYQNGVVQLFIGELILNTMLGFWFKVFVSSQSPSSCWFIASLRIDFNCVLFSLCFNQITSQKQATVIISDTFHPCLDMHIGGHFIRDNFILKHNEIIMDMKLHTNTGPNIQLDMARIRNYFATDLK